MSREVGESSHQRNRELTDDRTGNGLGLTGRCPEGSYTTTVIRALGPNFPDLYAVQMMLRSFKIVTDYPLRSPEHGIDAERGRPKWKNEDQQSQCDTRYVRWGKVHGTFAFFGDTPLRLLGYFETRRCGCTRSGVLSLR